MWWTKRPDANIGIATGKKSGIIAIDVDPRNGGRKTLEKLTSKLGAKGGTVTILTGGGG